MNRILNWFRLLRLEGDFDRELQYHIDRRVTDLMHSGLPEPEARRRTVLELGGTSQGASHRAARQNRYERSPLRREARVISQNGTWTKPHAAGQRL